MVIFQGSRQYAGLQRAETNPIPSAEAYATQTCAIECRFYWATYCCLLPGQTHIANTHRTHTHDQQTQQNRQMCKSSVAAAISVDVTNKPADKAPRTQTQDTHTTGEKKRRKKKYGAHIQNKHTRRIYFM